MLCLPATESKIFYVAGKENNFVKAMNCLSFALEIIINNNNLVKNRPCAHSPRDTQEKARRKSVVDRNREDTSQGTLANCRRLMVQRQSSFTSAISGATLMVRITCHCTLAMYLATLHSSTGTPARKTVVF